MCAALYSIPHPSITSVPIHSSYHIRTPGDLGASQSVQYTPPVPIGRAISLPSMKRHTIYHSSIEPGRIHLQRRGSSRVTIDKILEHTPRPCSDCVAHISGNHSACHSTLSTQGIYLASHVRHLSILLHVRILIFIGMVSIMILHDPARSALYRKYPVVLQFANCISLRASSSGPL